MELKQIKDLMTAMGRTGTKRVRIKQEDFELELERESQVQETPVETFVEMSGLHQVPISPEAKATKGRAADIPASLHPPLSHFDETKEEIDGQFVTSPMVGTIYLAAGPDESPFVKVGDKIEKDTVVCIIEAMKVMNDVKAGIEGTVTEVLVDNGHPVEFGTKLYKIS